jgi:hypothetical protein
MFFVSLFHVVNNFYKTYLRKTICNGFTIHEMYCLTLIIASAPLYIQECFEPEGQKSKAKVKEAKESDMCNGCVVSTKWTNSLCTKETMEHWWIVPFDARHRKIVVDKDNFFFASSSLFTSSFLWRKTQLFSFLLTYTLFFFSLSWFIISHPCTSDSIKFAIHF